MIYYILTLYVLPILINGICLYKDEDVKTVGDFVENSWMVVVPFINLFLMGVLIIGHTFILLENKFNFKKRWKNLMNKKL